LTDAQPRVSVIVPALDAGERVAGTVTALLEALASVGPLEILVVDDGSSDDTADAARGAGAVVISHATNRGKGAAVRTGMLRAAGKVRAFTDVDLSYPPEQLLQLVAAVESGADMVVGSRMHRDAVTVVDASRFRQVTSRLFNVATLALVGIYRDTQCGIKAFSAEAADRLFAASVVEGFAFDVELFMLARRWGLEVVEVPVRLSSSDTSTVHLRGELRAVWDLARLRLRRGLSRAGTEGPPSDPN
jgi:dolichyl-phosphate beta-glucosyltransferase